MPPADGDRLEGPRGFAVILQQIQDGELHSEIGAELQKLVALLSDQSNKLQAPRKGRITLTLDIIAVGSTVEVNGEVKTKVPTIRRPRSVFYRTPGGNLTLDNPRQQKLELREVPASTTKTKDIGTQETAVKGV